MSYLYIKIGSLKKIMKLLDFPQIIMIVLYVAIQKMRDFDNKFVFEYCPRGLIMFVFYDTMEKTCDFDNKDFRVAGFHINIFKILIIILALE